MNVISQHWKEYKRVWIYIIAIFIVTRLVLAGIGAVTHHYLPSTKYQSWREGMMQDSPTLAMFSVWDSRWYLKIAEHGYSDLKDFRTDKYSTIGYFPLYPTLAKPIGWLTGDYLLALIIVSNLFLLISAFLLYKLVRQHYDEQVAYRSIIYLFIFPVGYIFSAAYPMSLLLCLWLASILAINSNRHLLSGIFGFFASLTHPFGFLVFIPAIFVYLKRVNYKIKSIETTALYSLITPFGLLSWCVINYYLTGDYIAFAHTQFDVWDHDLSVPFVAMYQSLFYGFEYALNSIFIAPALLFFIVSYKKLPLAYWLLAIVAVLVNPITGTVIGSLRYLSFVFPIYILLALWSKNDKVHQVMLPAMAMIQGFLFVFWTLGYWFVS